MKTYEQLASTFKNVHTMEKYWYVCHWNVAYVWNCGIPVELELHFTHRRNTCCHSSRHSEEPLQAGSADYNSGSTQQSHCPPLGNPTQASSPQTKSPSHSSSLSQSPSFTPHGWEAVQHEASATDASHVIPSGKNFRSSKRGDIALRNLVSSEFTWPLCLEFTWFWYPVPQSVKQEDCGCP